MSIPIWAQIVESFAAALRFLTGWLGNPGLAIILFTLLLQALTLPITRRSVRAARAQQDTQAQIEEINARWKRDPARRQVETARLYQEQARGFLAGLLSALLQLLIFLALFQALAGLVAHDPAFAQPFLWVPNLAQPDPLFV